MMLRQGQQAGYIIKKKLLRNQNYSSQDRTENSGVATLDRQKSTGLSGSGGDDYDDDDVWF